MKEIELKNIKIDGIEINIKEYTDKTIYQDLKSLIYYEYENHKIKRRSYIEVIKPNVTEGEYIFKIVGHRLGTYKVDANKKAYIKEELNEINDTFFQLIPRKDKIDYVSRTENGVNIWNIHNSANKRLLEEYERYQYEGNNYNEVNKKQILNAYLNHGLFELYYKMLHKSLEFGKNGNKSMAMCSYVAFKDYFKNNNISYPNVFIKGIPTENDCLFLNKSCDNNENNYGFIINNKQDIKAVVELKTSGFFTKKSQLISGKKGFMKYITENDKELDDKPYLYFSYYESFASRKTSIHYYEFLLSELLYLEKGLNSKRKHVGLFAVTKKDSEHFLIPYEYDLEKFMKDNRDIFG